MHGAWFLEVAQHQLVFFCSSTFQQNAPPPISKLLQTCLFLFFVVFLSVQITEQPPKK